MYICICVYIYIYEHRSDDGMRGKFLSGFQLFSGILENGIPRGKDLQVFVHALLQKKTAPNPMRIEKESPLGNDFLLPKLKRLFVSNILALSRSQHHLRLSQDSVWLSLRCLPHESCHKISYPPIMSFW